MRETTEVGSTDEKTIVADTEEKTAESPLDPTPQPTETETTK